MQVAGCGMILNGDCVSSLTWHSIAIGIILSQFHASHHAVVVLLVLGATLVLPIRRGTTVEVVLARCHNRCSKLCLLFSPFAQESQLWDSHQLPWFKMVFNRACHCALQKSESARLYQFCQGDPDLCWGSFAFLIANLTFGQTHILPVGRRPACSGSFAFLRSRTGLCPSDGRRC